MRIPPSPLKHIAQSIFAKAGCHAAEAERIAHYLVESNLAGHDSHGVIRIPAYLRFLRDDIVRANQTMRVLFETETIAVVDGQFGFGQVIGESVMRLAIDKGRRSGVAAVAVRNCGHLGRIGDWPALAAREGLISLNFVNTSGFGLLVAPWGGKDRRLSANPLAIGVPVEGGVPIVVDISTCMIAEGKIRVALNKGALVPDGCLLDAEGRATNEPRVFYSDPPGSILPMAAHKGYALSVVVDLLAGALTGSGASGPDAKRLVNGMLVIVLDPRRFPADTGFTDEVRRFVAWLKSSRTLSPQGEVLLPGEWEERQRTRRLAEGIELDETTWGQLKQSWLSVGLPESEWDHTVG